MDALAPVFVVILLGHLAKRTRFLDDAFWPQAERVTYYLFFPALLVSKLSRAEISGEHAVPMGGVMVVAVLAVALVLFALRRWLRLDGPAFSSVFQGSIRPNTYVGLAAAAALYGDLGLALSAVVLVALIPTVNILCVSVVSHYGRGTGKGGFWQIPIELVKNPLIWGCAIGFILNLSGLELPESFIAVVATLGRAALPVGLLAVGAGLRLRGMGDRRNAVLFGAGIKLLVLPLLVALGCAVTGVQGPALTVAVLFATLPPAAASYILARQLGGDEKLMASIITVQTLFAFATMPIILALLGS